MQAMAKAKDTDEDLSRGNVMSERIRRNLERFIEESGYSVNQVADLSGVPQATLGRWVRGENAVSLPYLRPLADVFGRRTDDFYEADPPPPPPDLESRRPVFLRSRPGVELTEDDFADFEVFLEKVKTRRAKKTSLPTKKK